MGGPFAPYINWSGDPVGKVPLSGTVWESSPYYDSGFLNGPNGPGDTYLYLYDYAGGAQYYEFTTTFTASSSGSISFDFLNSYRSDASMLGGVGRIVLTSADGSLILVGSELDAPVAGMWNSVTIPLDVTSPDVQWTVAHPSNWLLAGPTAATQEQLDSIISEIGWKITFGIEGVTGGTGPTGPEFLAIDNLTFSGITVPEPSVALLVLGVFPLLVVRRRSKRK